ncbi:MAG: helix-turn-helix domain-containing protein [Bacteroidales bacterium]|nr:helix-turn-helix domain-containing protein [Bacteroidales bacterium]
MINRIELILKTQNLTPTQFADAIGIQRSSMSHILARRNNPSLDFVTKVLNRFPEINAEWLISGKNQMLNIATSHPTPSPTHTPEINTQIPEFEWNNEIVENDEETLHKETQRENVETQHNKMQRENVETPDYASPQKIPSTNQRDLNQNSDIERIIVFFTDGTFRSYTS